MSVEKSSSSQQFKRSVRRERMATKLSLSAAGWFAVAPLAHAADTPAAADTLEEIVVTAQFREERLQDTPIAITALSATALEERGQQSIAEITAQAPNVTLKPSAATFGNSMSASIRGVGQFDSTPAMEPGVGLYVDDVYFPQLTGANFDLLDLDRVEVLRGPQGTLAGKNSIGGAIKLYSKKPDGNGGGYVAVTYGRYNRTDIRASGDFSLVPDQLFVRVSGVRRKEDGYVKRVDYGCEHPGFTYPDGITPFPSQLSGGNCQLGTEGGKDYTAGRVALRWVPGDAFEANLSLDAINDKSEVQPGVLVGYSPSSSGVPPQSVTNLVLGSPDGNPANGYSPAQFIPSNPYTSYATFSMPGAIYFWNAGPGPATVPYPSPAHTASDKATFRSNGGSLSLDWTLTDRYSIKSITAYREFKSVAGLDDDNSPLPLALNELHTNNHYWSQELRFNGAIGNLMDYTVGGYYFKQKTHLGQYPDLAYSVPFFVFHAMDAIAANTKAAFLHTSWHLTDKLNLTVGYRYTQDKKDLTYSREDFPGYSLPSPPFPTPSAIALLGQSALNGKTGTYDGSRSDYRASVDYHWAPDFMTYFQFSTGFKGGGINPRPVTAAQVAPFGPETLQAYELGAKADLWDRRARVNASVFFTKYKDIQLVLLACPQLGPAPACFLPVNGGDADVKGVELELELHPAEGLTINASGSYLNFKYTRVDPTSGITTGMVTPFNPEKKASLGIQYDIPAGKAGFVTPRLDADYTDSYYSNAVNAPTNQVPSYTLLNAHLTWKSLDESWQASLEVANLTDKLYYNNMLDYAATFGAISGQPGKPRAWALTIKRNFK